MTGRSRRLEAGESEIFQQSVNAYLVVCEDEHAARDCRGVLAG